MGLLGKIFGGGEDYEDVYGNNMDYAEEPSWCEDDDDDDDDEGVPELYPYGEDYDNVYSVNGYVIECDICEGPMRNINGTYTCGSCGKTMTDDEFYEYVGDDVEH